MERNDETLSTRDLAAHDPVQQESTATGTEAAAPARGAPMDEPGPVQRQGQMEQPGPVQRQGQMEQPGLAQRRGQMEQPALAQRQGQMDEAGAVGAQPAEQPFESSQGPTATEPDSPGTATADPRTRSSTGESAGSEPLLAVEQSTSFQSRWEEIQTRFVDEPRGAVEDADTLVAELMQQLAEGFAQERERLEAQWGRGEDISTEDLRVALQRYRSFFQRLLST